MRVLVIENPAAGSGRAQRRAAGLVSALERRGHRVEWLLTERPGDARRLAGEREGRVDCIVAAGGDGTLNEVLNGLADPARTPLAPLALGTANMLARELGIPVEAEALAARVETESVRRVDMGRVGDTRFLCVVGVGFDAMVTERVARTRRGRLGYRGYVVPIASTFARYRPPRLTARLDGGESVACELAIVGNLRDYGGVLRVTASASCDSGRLDACLFRSARRTELLRYALEASRGRLASDPGVDCRTATRIEIDAARPVPVQVDGEAWGHTPIAIEVEPGAVPILGAQAGSARRPASPRSGALSG